MINPALEILVKIESATTDFNESETPEYSIDIEAYLKSTG